MRGLKLLAASLAANNNKNFISSPSSLSTQLEQPQIDEPVYGRRKALQQLLFAGTAAMAASPAFALDMDAFVNSELDSDTKNCDPKKDPKCIPKLSADEALCKYGQSGEARGEACKRVKKAGGELPGATKTKSLGGAYAM